MKKESIISICSFLILYSLLAAKINNDIFLPSIVAIIKYLIHLLKDANTYMIIIETIKRTCIAFFISMVVGTSIGIVAASFKKIYAYVNPLIVVLKTIPNISYMFLLLLWINKASSATYYIVFFILFPLFYDGAYNTLQSMDQDLKDVICIYPEKYLEIVKKIYIPECIDKMKGINISAISLGFKVCIMSEVLGFVKKGIGREMYFNKANLDMVGVFAWTIIVIIVVYIFESFVRFLNKKVC